MLNRWKSAWQDQTYRRIVIALVFSLLLHLLLMAQFYITLPDLDETKKVIDARLVLPQKIPNKSPSASDIKPSAETSKTLKKPAIEPKLSSEPLPEPIINDVPIFPSDLFQDAAEAVKPVELLPTDTQLELEESKGEEVGLIVDPNPYEYVESEFDVYTDKETSLKNSPAGKARIVYQRLPDTEQYRIKSVIQAKGLAALIIPDLLQTSDGILSISGLQPQHYLYQFGDNKNKTFSANFDWQNKKINLQGERGQQQLDLTEGTQDLLSFMYQFMFVAPLQNMQLSITNGKKVAIYDYSFEGEEVINTKMGDIKTYHLKRSATEGDKKTELWLASEYQHVPVKIRESGKNGKVYELLIKSLKTDIPELNPR
ncbi:MAG: DUF3108 domain-containing protein [Methylotenera sp.]|nr:DUF3108 domain-containing protein [Methylotenera sp.]